MQSSKRAGYSLLLAALFGVAAALLKGTDAGLRAQIGNVSAPWLLVAFLPSLRSRTLAGGALTGLASTCLALTGFYATLSVLLRGHLGANGYLSALTTEIGANRIYMLAGIVTGPVFGALGAWMACRRAQRVWLVVGGLLTGEILVVWMIQGRQLLPSPLYFRWGVGDWRVYFAELGCGLAIILASLWRRRATPA